MTESDIIGAIGGMGIPPVVEFIEGYQNGAQCDNSNVVVLVKYTHDWFDPAGGAAIAEDMVADGADVIFQPAGATGNGACWRPHNRVNGLLVWMLINITHFSRMAL